MQVANGNKTRYCWKKGRSHFLLCNADLLRWLLQLQIGDTDVARYTFSFT